MSRTIERARGGSSAVATFARARIVRPVIPAPLHASLPLAILGLWALAIQNVRLGDMTDLGLVSVMPLSAFALLFVLTVSFCVALAGRPLQVWVALTHVLVLVVILYGVTGFLEPEPRFAALWRHVGIIDYIATHQAVNPRIDAYFSWPGFFTLGATMVKAAGAASPLAVAGYAPLAFNLLFLPPLLVIFRWASDDPRVSWLGLWVFYSANWVGQDYLSPQAIGFLLWLSMLAALLTRFTPPPAVLAGRPSVRRLIALARVGRLRARLRSEADSAAERRWPYPRAALLVVVVGIFAAIVTGHQLTPFPALLAVTALVLFAGLETRGLPLIMAVLLGAWITYMTTTYLSGHFHDVTGSVGSAGANLGENVGGRIQGSGEHEFIVHIRVLASLAIWGLAVLGLARRLLWRRFDVALMVIGGTPLLLPLIQTYGGEIVLRVFLFSLPGVAFFIAALAFPAPAAGRRPLTLVAVGALSCALLASFQFTRYGNERLDNFSRGDVAAVSALYRAAPRGATLIGAENLPWRHHDYAAYDYRRVSDFAAWRAAEPNSARLARQIVASAKPDGAYVIVTRSSRDYARMLLGKEPALTGLVARLRRSPASTEIYRGRDGDVFRIRG